MAPQKPIKGPKQITVFSKKKAKEDRSSAGSIQSRVSKKPKTNTLTAHCSAKSENNDVPSFAPDEDDQGAVITPELLQFIESDDEKEDGDEKEGEVSTASHDETVIIANVPKVPKHTKPTKKKNDEATGVVYIGRVPHGFYEHQMREYFSQFGDITNLRLSRNKRTGASKHYAFIEFAEESTAEIVAKTMDNYLLFGHILKVKVVPKDQVHPDLWKGSNRRFKAVPWRRLEGKELTRPKTKEQWNNSINKEERRRKKLAKRLETMGYDFAMPSLSAPPQPVALITSEKIESSNGDVIKHGQEKEKAVVKEKYIKSVGNVEGDEKGNEAPRSSMEKGAKEAKARGKTQKA